MADNKAADKEVEDEEAVGDEAVSENDTAQQEDEGDVSDVSASADSSSDENEIRGNSSDTKLRECVTQLIQVDNCEAICLEGKADKLEGFLCSVSQMTPSEKKRSIMTSLAASTEAEVVEHRRGYGIRDKLPYIPPLVGKATTDMSLALPVAMNTVPTSRAPTVSTR
ncbi:hypothetical protein PybrP1_004891 [[Pythium] brassicae (nom. inval.)]|nr:hypothetical protein PybrP1_004891 [[Pythium] brassicae (nom. inval.)]